MPSPLHAAGLLLLTGPAISADGSTLDATGSVIQMLLGLGLVIGLLYATLHILRRIGGGNTQAGAMLKIRCRGRRPAGESYWWKWRTGCWCSASLPGG
jgi:hypothetical protein